MKRPLLCGQPESGPSALLPCVLRKLFLHVFTCGIVSAYHLGCELLRTEMGACYTHLWSQLTAQLRSGHQPAQPGMNDVSESPVRAAKGTCVCPPTGAGVRAGDVRDHMTTLFPCSPSPPTAGSGQIRPGTAVLSPVHPAEPEVIRGCVAHR